jgi:hypothetical protein
VAWTKADLINELGSIRGYRSYLEICTPTAGRLYRMVDRARYTCHRLMYRYPATLIDKLMYLARIRDGMPIDFCTSDLDISECVRKIRARKLSYDVILVDSFHEYRQTTRDIADATRLLNPGGTIVVHDCFPRDVALAAPGFVNGAWCGVVYKAYLDIVLSRKDLDYCTVDTDFGCGIIRVNGGDRPLSRLAERAGAAQDKDHLVDKWKRFGDDYTAAFAFLSENAATLLNLVSVDEFLAAEWSGVRARA